MPGRAVGRRRLRVDRLHRARPSWPGRLQHPGPGRWRRRTDVRPGGDAQPGRHLEHRLEEGPAAAGLRHGQGERRSPGLTPLPKDGMLRASVRMRIENGTHTYSTNVHADTPPDRRRRGRGACREAPHRPTETTGAIAIIVAIFAVDDARAGGDGRRPRLRPGDPAARRQNTADAAALAGAGELYDNAGTVQPIKSIAAVKDYAARQLRHQRPPTGPAARPTSRPAGAPPSAGQSTGTTCIAYDSATVPKKVQVVMPLRHTAGVLRRRVGYQGSDISRTGSGSPSTRQHVLAAWSASSRRTRDRTATWR